jgi:hypothetical protein
MRRLLRFSSINMPAPYSCCGTDPPNTAQHYDIQGGGTVQLRRHSRRWGDPSATVVDPLNDTDLWTIQGPPPPGQHVGHAVGRVAPPPAPLPLCNW